MDEQKKSRYERFKDAFELAEHVKSIKLQIYHANSYWQMPEWLEGEVTPQIRSLAKETLRVSEKAYTKAKEIIEKYGEFDFQNPLARRVVNLEQVIESFRKIHKDLSSWIKEHSKDD